MCVGFGFGFVSGSALGLGVLGIYAFSRVLRLTWVVDQVYWDVRQVFQLPFDMSLPPRDQLGPANIAWGHKAQGSSRSECVCECNTDSVGGSFHGCKPMWANIGRHRNLHGSLNCTLTRSRSSLIEAVRRVVSDAKAEEF
eukprot:307189-Amorphochlora_amoeboformis.AAC.2